MFILICNWVSCLFGYHLFQYRHTYRTDETYLIEVSTCVHCNCEALEEIFEPLEEDEDEVPKPANCVICSKELEFHRFGFFESDYYMNIVDGGGNIEIKFQYGKHKGLSIKGHICDDCFDSKKIKELDLSRLYL